MAGFRWGEEELEKVARIMVQFKLHPESSPRGYSNQLEEAQKVLPEHKRYVISTLRVQNRVVVERLHPFMDRMLRDTPESEHGSEVLPFPNKETSARPMTLDDLFEKLWPMLWAEIANRMALEGHRIQEEMKIEIGRIIESRIPKDRPMSPAQLRSLAIEMQSGDPNKPRRPKVLIFGLNDSQSASPKLNPFRKVLDLQVWEDKVTDDLEQLARSADYIFVLVNKVSFVIPKIREVAGSRLIPVYGGTSALEAALQTVCSANHFVITPSTKAHLGV